MLANLFKSYVINTIIGFIVAFLLVWATGRPLTSEDYLALVTFGWMFGWGIGKLAKAQIETTKGAVDEIKRIRDKE